VKLLVDLKLKKVGCVLLQAAHQTDYQEVNFGSLFDTSDWFIHPTPDMKVYLMTIEQINEFAKRLKEERDKKVKELKVDHRGYEIEVKREKSMAGWSMLYYSIVRKHDGYVPVDSFCDSDDTVPTMVKQLKNRIDSELEDDDPWGENSSGALI
jgi:hypothetical protein